MLVCIFLLSDATKEDLWICAHYIHTSQHSTAKLKKCLFLFTMLNNNFKVKELITFVCIDQYSRSLSDLHVGGTIKSTRSFLLQGEVRNQKHNSKRKSC